MMWPLWRTGPSVRQISAPEAHQELQRENVVLVDVREDFEFRHCRIDGAIHIPLRQLLRGGERSLDPSSEIICYCHHGHRSQRAGEYLLSRGFQQVSNLAGGIHAWSLEVDHELPTY